MTEGFPKEARKAARERCDSATGGEWGRYGYPDAEGVVHPQKGAYEVEAGLALGSTRHTEPLARFNGYLLPVEANIDFCIHARTDLPRALDHIDTQEQRIRELESVLERIRSHAPEAIGGEPYLLPAGGFYSIDRVLRGSVDKTEPTTTNEVEEEE